MPTETLAFLLPIHQSQSRVLLSSRGHRERGKRRPRRLENNSRCAFSSLFSASFAGRHRIYSPFIWPPRGFAAIDSPFLVLLVVVVVVGELWRGGTLSGKSLRGKIYRGRMNTLSLLRLSNTREDPPLWRAWLGALHSVMETRNYVRQLYLVRLAFFCSRTQLKRRGRRGGMGTLLLLRARGAPFLPLQLFFSQSVSLSLGQKPASNMRNKRSS